LPARVRRIRGQIEQVMDLIAGARGTMAGMMAEVVEDHVRRHLVDDAKYRGIPMPLSDCRRWFGPTSCADHQSRLDELGPGHLGAIVSIAMQRGRAEDRRLARRGSARRCV
jgi:hypothetical protein